MAAARRRLAQAVAQFARQAAVSGRAGPALSSSAAFECATTSAAAQGASLARSKVRTDAPDGPAIAAGAKIGARCRRRSPPPPDAAAFPPCPSPLTFPAAVPLGQGLSGFCSSRPDDCGRASQCGLRTRCRSRGATAAGATDHSVGGGWYPRDAPCPAASCKGTDSWPRVPQPCWLQLAGPPKSTPPKAKDDPTRHKVGAAPAGLFGLPLLGLFGAAAAGQCAACLLCRFSLVPEHLPYSDAAAFPPTAWCAGGVCAGRPRQRQGHPERAAGGGVWGGAPQVGAGRAD